MKLEPNMYVRTYDGYISKIKKVNQYNVIVDARDLFGEELNIPNNEILKASHNIIDLIEVGDYVNGYKVIGITDEYIDLNSGFDTRKILLVLNGEVYEEGISLKEKDIKSIVTKEMFANAEYKVGE